MKNKQTLQDLRQAKSPKSLLPLAAGIALALSFSSQSQAGLITDGGFINPLVNSTSPNAYNMDQTVAKDTWIVSNQSNSDAWNRNSTNQNVSIKSPNNRYRAMIQVITNDIHQANGLLDFSIDTVASGNGSLNIEVWGIETADTYNLDLAAGNNSTVPNSDSTANINLLTPSGIDLTSQLGGTATASFNIGTSTTYDFLALRINAFGWDTDAGDALTVDNVVLEVHPVDPPVSTPAPAAVLLLLSGLVGFNMKNRKKKISI